MEDHLRGIVGQLTVEQIVEEPEIVAEQCTEEEHQQATWHGKADLPPK